MRAAIPTMLGVPNSMRNGYLFEMIGMNRINTGAAAPGLFELDTLSDAQAADTGTSHERLVAGERESVDIHLLHVYRHHAGRLR